MSIESGSSLGWSLTGHQRSAPAVWQEVAIHGAPSGVSAHVKPPFHGGFGALRGEPAYRTATRRVSPGRTISGRSIHTWLSLSLRVTGRSSSPDIDGTH